HAAWVHQHLVHVLKRRTGTGVVLLLGLGDGGTLRVRGDEHGAAGQGGQQDSSRHGNGPRCYAFFSSPAWIGSRRSRFPVTAKIAFATAGATVGTPGSPTPPIFSLLGTICASTTGISFMRSIR